MVENHKMKKEGKTKDQFIGEPAELSQRLTELETLEAERRRAKKTIMGSRIWLPVACSFVLLCIFVWLNEILDFPHLLLSAPPTPINWHKAISETVLVAIVGLFMVSRFIHNITKRKWAEEELRKYHDHLEDLVKERTAELTMANEQLQREIIERKQAEEALHESEKRYRTLFEGSREAIYITSQEGKIVGANQSFLDLFSYTREELEELDVWKTYVHPDERLRFQRVIEQEGSVRDFEVKLCKKDGTEMDCLLTATVRRADDGSILGYQGIIRDITERKRAEEEIAYMATHDLLTDLPNRMLFNDRLNVALVQVQRQKRKLAVMLLDLDYFKDINDTLGHSVGDKLLRTVGDRLTKLLRKGDTVARMGGDEFLLLLTEIARVEDATRIARKVLEGFREPFVFDVHQLHITTSIGVVIYPYDGEDVATLEKNADIAMYHAKEKGRNNYQRYTAVLNNKGVG